MAPKKGSCNNPHGRPKGSKNKVARSAKELLSGFITKKLERIEELYIVLEPKEQARLISSLIGFVMPKMTEVSLENEISYLLGHIEKLSDEQLERLHQIISDVVGNGTND